MLLRLTKKRQLIRMLTMQNAIDVLTIALTVTYVLLYLLQNKWLIVHHLTNSICRTQKKAILPPGGQVVHAIRIFDILHWYYATKIQGGICPYSITQI